MKIVDRYIFSGFLFSVLVVFVSMVGLTIMVDMAINIDEFMKMERQAGDAGAIALTGRIAQYYFYRLFEYFQWLCGAATLVGAAFAIARLNKSNELVAFKASGVSVYRLLWPVVAASVLLAALFVLNQEVAIPAVSDKLIAGRAGALGGKDVPVQYVTDSNNSLIYAPRFSPSQQTMEADKKFAADGRTLVYYRPIIIVQRHRTTGVNEYFIEADKAVYDEPRRGWRLIGGRRWSVGTAGEPADVFGEGRPVDFYATDANPQILARQNKRNYFNYLSFATLSQMVSDSALPNTAVHQVTMYQHLAKPILNLVLLLLGLPFVVGREGRNYAASVMVCIGLYVLALMVEYAAVEYGRMGYVSPLLAAFLPVLIFTPVAVWSLERVST